MSRSRLRVLCVGLTFCLALLGPSAVAEQAEVSLTVVSRANQLPPGTVAFIEAAGGRVDRAIPSIGVVQVSGPSSLISTLSRNSAIQAVSPSLVERFRPTEVAESPIVRGGSLPGVVADYYEQYQWDIKQVTDHGASFALGTGSHQTIVAVLDSGVNTQHPDLAPNLLGGRNYVTDGPGGLADPDDIEDRHGHGSHVTGAIAARGRILGVAPDVGIRTYRVLAADAFGTWPWIIAAIVDAANDGADVISMSLGGYHAISRVEWTSPDGEVFVFRDLADHLALQRAIRYATGKGSVVVAAAMNDAINITNPTNVTELMNELYGPFGYRIIGAARTNPASLPGVVTVSATGPDMSLSSYSNYGPGSINVCAPGGDFLRFPEPDWFTDMCFGAYMIFDGEPEVYTFFAGTSMAAPKVSAVVALIIDQEKQRGQALTPQQVVTRLQQSAISLGKPGSSKEFGHGMVNAVNALMGR